MGELTVDCTTEHSNSKTARVVVDFGTQAGNQVPVGDFFNIPVNIQRSQQDVHTKMWRAQASTVALGKACYRMQRDDEPFWKGAM